MEDLQPPSQKQLLLKQLRLPLRILALIASIYRVQKSSGAAHEIQHVHKVVVPDVLSGVECKFGLPPRAPL